MAKSKVASEGQVYPVLSAGSRRTPKVDQRGVLSTAVLDQQSDMTIIRVGKKSITVPTETVLLLERISADIASGNRVSLFAVNDSDEVTTDRAARILNVSRPFVIEHIENGVLPARKVGTQRRIRLEDILKLKRSIQKQQEKALRELAALDRELGLDR